MNYVKKSVADASLKGKKVLLRCDFNVPLKDGVIGDDTRIRAALETIRFILREGGAVIACSHLGRPKGQVVPEMSLKPVAVRLGELLAQPVAMAPDCVGAETEAMAKALQPGEVLLLENLRFHKEEEKNDPAFAKALASLADIYVSDAFGTVHRAHASTAGVADYLPAYCGFLIAAELKALGGAVNDPVRPWWPCWAAPRWRTSWRSSTTFWTKRIPCSSAAACPTPSPRHWAGRSATPSWTRRSSNTCRR